MYGADRNPAVPCDPTEDEGYQRRCLGYLFAVYLSRDIWWMAKEWCVSLLPPLPPMVLQKWSFGVRFFLKAALAVECWLVQVYRARWGKLRRISASTGYIHLLQLTTSSSRLYVCLCVVPRALASLPANHKDDDVRVRQVRIQSAIDNHLQREITYRQWLIDAPLLLKRV